VALGTVVDAKKVRYDRRGVRQVLEGVTEIHSMRGKQVQHLVVTPGKPPSKAVLAAILGPFGNLRAPTVRRGHVLLVGFDESTYTDVLMK